MRQSWGGAGAWGLGARDQKTCGYSGSRSAESGTPAWARSTRKSRRDVMPLGRDAAEIDLEIRGVGAERLARPGPGHRGAPRQRNDAVVIADERPDAVGARRAGDAERRRIPARFRDARRRPRPAAVRTRNVRDIEQGVAAVAAVIGHQVEPAARRLDAQLDIDAIARCGRNDRRRAPLRDVADVRVRQQNLRLSVRDIGIRHVETARGWIERGGGIGARRAELPARDVEAVRRVETHGILERREPEGDVPRPGVGCWYAHGAPRALSRLRREVRRDARL